MAFLDDLRYFGPRLGPARAVQLVVAKLAKRREKQRAALELAAPESDEQLCARLGIPTELAQRADALRGLLAPLAGASEAYNSQTGPLRRRADLVLEGEQLLFGQRLQVGWPIHWNWRWDDTPNATRFANDIRSTWELQRLQGILPLARAAHTVGGDDSERYAAAYLQALGSFHTAHPGPHGDAWESALEVGLRLIALAQGLPLVAHTNAFANNPLTALRMVDRHARWLRADLSLDKVVRGNHLLGELAGLICAGQLFPQAQRVYWRGLLPRELLLTEVNAQITADGVSVEQSLTYEKFVLELLALPAALGELRGEPLGLDARLVACAQHLELCTAPDGTLPRIGDCDSGRGADWGDENPHDPRNLCAFVTERWGTPTETHILPAGDAWASRPTTLFPLGGHAVLRPGNGAFAFLRGGPFGWGIPGPASHSHADLLAPVLYHQGEPVLVDPGVTGYRVPDRNAHRVWSAHSALDPGPDHGPFPDGTFRWRGITVQARAEVAHDDGVWVLGGQATWGQGSQPLVWQRSMRYNQLDDTWLILDRLSHHPKGPRRWAFCFAPGIQLTPLPEPGAVRIALPSGRGLVWRADPPGELGIETGIVASAYGLRAEAPVLRRRVDGDRSEIRITPDN